MKHHMYKYCCYVFPVADDRYHLMLCDLQLCMNYPLSKIRRVYLLSVVDQLVENGSEMY